MNWNIAIIKRTSDGATRPAVKLVRASDKRNAEMEIGNRISDRFVFEGFIDPKNFSGPLAEALQKFDQICSDLISADDESRRVLEKILSLLLQCGASGHGNVHDAV